MKRLLSIIIQTRTVALLGVLFFLLSCTKDFEEINTNKNAVAAPLSKADLPFLFSKAQSTATNSQWNYQVAQNLFADQYAQYFACVATYFPSDRLFIRMDWVGAAFNPMYTDVMPQLQTLFQEYDTNSAEYALANIWWVYTFHRVTDYWGPIPYSKAGIAGTSVEYDAQDKIYDDFFKRLDASVKVLKANTSAKPYGDYDLVYGGDVSKWIKFANTLRLRLAMRVSKVDPARAKTEGEAAVASGVMLTSPDDDALVLRSKKGSDGNGLSIMSDWNEFRMSASMESVLKGYDDPRMEEYFLPTVNTKDLDVPEYHGLRNGLTAAQLTESVNKADANSHVGQRWTSTGLETPQNVMCTAEAYFLRAEGALLGWNVGGTAKDFYEAGITQSMLQWDVKIGDYVSRMQTPVAPGDFLGSAPMTNIPVKFHDSDINIQKEQIATQKWLALFPDGMEAWADYRRSHILKLYPVANSENTDITNTSTQWLRRIPFLLSEKQTNGPAVTNAEKLLGGPDKVTTPLWWDKN